MRAAVAAAIVAATIALAGAAATSAPATPTPTPTPTPSPTAPVDPIRAAQYWLDDYGIRTAWETTRGEGVRIAIIDTGVGRGPVEFSGVVGGADFSGLGASDGRSSVGAVDADHGSWVASLAGARGTGAETGMLGVAPDAELLSLSIGFGSSVSVPFVEQVADAIRWAVDNGADVINLSFTTNTLTWDPLWDDAFLYAFDNDVVVVVAAGNRGNGTEEVGAPATIPGVLTVAGVDRSGQVSQGASTQGITVGISAPSEQLLGVSADGRVVQWEGTGGAAPIVAGIVALVRAAHPELDANNVINRIVSTARPAAGATAVPDNLYGFGLVDAAAAVSAPVDAVDANPMGDLAEWIRLYRRAEQTPEPEPTVAPVDVPALPQAESAPRVSPLVPSTDTLRYGTLPLAAGTLAAILVALGVTAAARRILSTRAMRTPNPRTEESFPP
ncbi:S8 family serine peptidase [Microbacterium sp. No. 7]|uniref:S8 family serine peptidase n=1 Tax=Microbacterium sp. No. 7 TaxID=1714373 RepID=UPI0006D2B899|nr:S8 family serine peptidase [Microbacterium sp. No. 7]ALJ19842.1 peptidase S8 [Microbacterium sp. No. 7]